MLSVLAGASQQDFAGARLQNGFSLAWMSTHNTQAIELLQWALPRLGLRWPGFRKVRQQVIKRITRRLRVLRLPDIDAYRSYLETQQEEWKVLDSFCRITVSRFYRDRGIFDILGAEGLPELMDRCRTRGGLRLRCWSAGCGAGEEPYTLVLIWALHPDLRAWDIALSVLATDADPAQIARARTGRYAPSSLRELPAPWRDIAFSADAGGYRIRQEYCQPLTWAVMDLRKAMPEGLFDLILCRNLAFTYFSTDLQREILQRLGDRLSPDGLLVLGSHEVLPEGSVDWNRWRPGLPIYRKLE
jgi:chemotaxis protein methyltransferase CheR